MRETTINRCLFDYSLAIGDKTDSTYSRYIIRLEQLNMAGASIDTHRQSQTVPKTRGNSTPELLFFHFSNRHSKRNELDGRYIRFGVTHLKRKKSGVNFVLSCNLVHQGISLFNAFIIISSFPLVVPSPHVAHSILCLLHANSLLFLFSQVTP